MLRLAAGVQAAEAAGLAVAGVLTAIAAASGRSYQASSGVALTLLVFVVVAGLAWIASGIARVRPWSRTPAVMTQVLTGVIAIYLLQAHRLDWGVPALLLAVAGLAGLLAPSSLRALSHASPPSKPGLIVDREPLPELSEGPGQQPGHVHLGDAQLGGDL
jgi:hypothetical protein